MTRPTTYWDYLRLQELLALQGGVERNEEAIDGEEVLFITVHQVFELLFKLVARELRAARELFGQALVHEDRIAGAVESLRRVQTIFRCATGHFEIIETLGLREYLEFRDSLMPASGYQSFQLRQIEALLGLEESQRIPLGAHRAPLDALREPDGSEGYALRAVRTELDSDEPSVKVAIERWLARTPIDGVPVDQEGADEALEAFVERYLDAHARETDGTLAHAQTLAGSDAERERLAAMYEREKEGARAFLRPSEAEGGNERMRIRAAMTFIETYRELPLLTWPRQVLAALLEVEQAFLIFRQRHARMVERVIGRRTGTGGSDGVDYLDRTALTYRIFSDLWAVRTMMVRRAAAPPLEREAYYGFRSVE